MNGRADKEPGAAVLRLENATGQDRRLKLFKHNLLTNRLIRGTIAIENRLQKGG
jgi:hypothetical protein